VLRLPEYRHVELTITSKDVLHSFWVPQMFQKQDAVPGLPTHLVITPTRLGVFPVVCVALCGLGHSTMRSQTIVLSQVANDKWYTSGAAAAAAPAAGGGGASALATFNQNGCGACHTFTAAKSTGKIGPDLDKLKQAAATAGQPLDAFIKQSITDPNAYIAPGYAKGVMPPTFKQQIPADKLDQLVQYLAQNAK
jgi:cytochrome c oxidase subunit 2